MAESPKSISEKAITEKTDEIIDALIENLSSPDRTSLPELLLKEKSRLRDLKIEQGDLDDDFQRLNGLFSEIETELEQWWGETDQEGFNTIARRSKQSLIDAIENLKSVVMGGAVFLWKKERLAKFNLDMQRAEIRVKAMEAAKDIADARGSKRGVPKDDVGEDAEGVGDNAKRR